MFLVTFDFEYTVIILINVGSINLIFRLQRAALVTGGVKKKRGI